MKPLSLVLFLFFAVPAIAQTDTATKIELNLPDTAFINSQMRRIDSINNAESMRNMDRNMGSLLSDIRERDRKAKQQMWMRLGFAGLMIIIAIIGFTRRRKAKDPK
jgi:hypothetical protein